MAQKILRLPAVLEVFGGGKSKLWEDIKKGLFPGPLPLGPGSVGWLESEIDEWQLAKIAERDAATRTPKGKYQPRRDQQTA